MSNENIYTHIKDVFIDEETRRHNTIEDDARRLGFNIQKTVITFYPIDFVFEKKYFPIS